jgi:hypothetical protein
MRGWIEVGFLKGGALVVRVVIDVENGSDLWRGFVVEMGKMGPEIGDYDWVSR